jgi:NAD(P)-dependent dehydrogenase (short-subunit alcohol dehydrogenase family)
MVNLDTVHAINRDLVQTQPLVAVFTGGTGGIGSLTLKAFARTAAKHNACGLRVYIIGRNASAAEKLMVECRSIYPEGQYHFIKVDDLSLIGDVDKACKELIEAEERNAAAVKQTARIDYLMLSHGGPIFLPRQGTSIARPPSKSRLPYSWASATDTKEGLDGTMSRFYYSRIAFITLLTPFLVQSSLPATVISVYAAGMEAKLYPDDLSLRNPSHYSYSQARSHIVYMHTCYFEELAKSHRNQLRLTHIFPGLVVHEGMYSMSNPWWLRVLFTRVLPLFGVDVDLEESGERMVSLASPAYYPAQSQNDSAIDKIAITGTDGKLGSGAYALGWSGETVYPKKRYASLDKEGLRKNVWDHTNQALDDIRTQGIFKD